MPILIFLLFDEFDPVIGDVHREAIVKSVTAVFKRRGESRHTADIFGNGDSIRIDFMNEPVCERQIANGIVILMSVEIVPVAGEILAQSVTVIKH